jgi:DNA-binding MarR family transcriptional regulator
MKLEEAIQSTNFKSNAQKAVLNVLYTAWWLKTQTNQALKKQGLTHEQYNVMRILKGKHPQAMCVKDIAGRVIEKNSNIPRIIDRLVNKQWVQRSQGTADKRETLMNLTAKGLATLAVATKDMDMTMGSVLSLSEEDARLLDDLLERLRAS